MRLQVLNLSFETVVGVEFFSGSLGLLVGMWLPLIGVGLGR